jgi:predicted GIY-YIG superfamily endonuclease
MKHCSKCGETKEVSAFSKNKSRKDGLDNQCKVCRSKWRSKNKDKMNDYNRTYRAKAKPCVYRIKHKQDDSYYVGQTTQHLSRRAHNHFSSKCCLRSFFTGLNKDDWIIETLCYGTKEQVRHLEKVLLEKRIGIDPKCLNKHNW